MATKENQALNVQAVETGFPALISGGRLVEATHPKRAGKGTSQKCALLKRCSPVLSNVLALHAG